MRLVIDAHLDLAVNAVQLDRDLSCELSDLNAQEANMKDLPYRGHAVVSLPEMRKARVALCLGTLLARTTVARRTERGASRADIDHFFPDAAYAAAHAHLAYYRMLRSSGQVALVTSREDLKAHWKLWDRPGAVDADPPIGIIPSMEGADPIVSADQAEEWWEDGLRVVSLAHYGASRYAIGTGGTGPLTPQGRSLLYKFEKLGMILDLSHLCDESLQEALDVYRGPVLASHSNCRAVVAGGRQMSDGQISKVVARGGVIGVSLDAWMLYPGWVRGSTSTDVLPIDSVADHIDHICQVAGNISHAAIGSDLDGGFGWEQTPRDFRSIAHLHRIEEVLDKRGYKAPEIDAVFHGNWLDFFTKNLPARVSAS